MPPPFREPILAWHGQEIAATAIQGVLAHKVRFTGSQDTLYWLRDRACDLSEPRLEGAPLGHDARGAATQAPSACAVGGNLRQERAGRVQPWPPERRHGPGPHPSRARDMGAARTSAADRGHGSRTSTRTPKAAAAASVAIAGEG